jgi:hypothetical protein
MRLNRAVSRSRETFSSLPIEQTFDKIYEANHWGGGRGDFCSGSGSADTFAEPYCELVRAFIAQHELKTVVDLGCGDFRVGRKICSPSIRYLGVDIVSSLTQRLNSVFGSEKTAFHQLNIVTQAPPDGDLCLIRQVLQHLSNSEIAQVLRNVQKYAYAIITEHVPVFPERVNLDKPHGPDIRIYKHSGVFLDEVPFSLKVETLLEVPVGRDEVLRTVLWRPRL